MYKVFVDGSAGTTGLRIYGRLSERTDIELLTLPDNLRKDASAREEKIKFGGRCIFMSARRRRAGSRFDA